MYIGIKIKSDNEKPSLDANLKFRFSGFSLTKKGNSKIIAGPLFNNSGTREKSDLQNHEKITVNSHGASNIAVKKTNCDFSEMIY